MGERLSKPVAYVTIATACFFVWAFIVGVGTIVVEKRVVESCREYNGVALRGMYFYCTRTQ
jgi:hypothetical protein